MMNNSYERIMEDADQEWKFSRSRLWLDYINEGNFVPVPFNIAYYSLYLFFIPNYIFRVCCRKEQWTRSRKQPSNETDVELERMNSNLERCTTDKTLTHWFSCICPGCSCFCKPTQAKVVREERLQAIRFSVARYLNNHYPNEEIEREMGTLVSSPAPKADESLQE